MWILLLIINMVDAYLNDEQYHFGVNEYIFPYDWIYQTKQNYLIYGIVSIVFLFGMLAAGWLKRNNIYFLLCSVYLLFILYSRIVIN